MRGMDIDRAIAPLLVKYNKKLIVCAYDELAFIDRNKYIYIVNTAHSTKTGEHWICIFPCGAYIEVFDSLANDRNVKFINRLVSKKNVNKNKKRIQSIHDSLCGQYVMFYIFHKLVYNQSLYDIMKYFSNNYIMNGILLNNFISHHLPMYNVTFEK